MKEKIVIGKNSFVSKDCILKGKVVIGDNCNIVHSDISNTQIANGVEIKNSQVEDSTIKDNVKINFSVIEKSIIENNVAIGPYAHLRPNCTLKENVKVGNFVELKNCTIGKGTKIPHLSYVGDATLGKDVNVGCGVIFCNYDGMKKERSVIKDRVFIGSNSNIVAPVTIEIDSFIAAGSTITQDVKSKEFAISRCRQQNKKYVRNAYALKFKQPLKYFGTDGIRGIYNKDLTDELAIKVGYSVSMLKKNAKVLIGRDTRKSSVNLLENLAKGLCSGGGQVLDAGVISTAGLAYLTKHHDYDYGIEITASHNPSEYNGIKIFDRNGYKINENLEYIIEENLVLPSRVKKAEIISIDRTPYFDFLNSICKKNLKGLKILIDLSNGAVSNYAKDIFEKLNAIVITINDGGEINKNAGILDEKIFINNMKKYDADIGFCFDGDADRVMCMTKNLKLIDGDKILYILVKYFKQDYAVGTIMTNLALEKELKNIGTKLVRVDVGDRNIASTIKKKNYLLGAEQSGHVIISSFATTGDGVMTALILLNIFAENKKIFNSSENLNFYPTISKKIKVIDKSIIKNEELNKLINQEQVSLRNSGRIIVRPSGTEPVIRVTVEAKDENKAKVVAEKIANFIEKLIH